MDDSTPRTQRRAFDLALPLRITATLAFIAILAVTVGQVFFRYVLGSPLIWSEELARLLIVWVAFIGGAAVCWEGRHLNVDFLFTGMSNRTRRVVRLFNLAVALAFLLVLVYFSIPVVVFENYQEMSVLPLPGGTARLAATVGGGFAIVMVLARALYRRRVETDSQKNDPV